MSDFCLSDKQLRVWRGCFLEHHRWNVSTGATRSGKTYLDYFKIPARIRAADESGLILLLGNTKGTLERNILDPLRQIWGKRLVGTLGSNNKIQLFGRECYALGADKITQVRRLQGASLSYCYGDEVATWHQDVFEMLKSRLDKPGACFDGTCNPDVPTHWFKTFLDSDADIFQMHFTIDDNPFLEPGFVADLKREYAGTVYYDRFILGRWKRADGAIYRSFAANPERFELDPKKRQYIAVNIGVDFGGNKSQSAFVATGFTEGFREAVVLMEEMRPAATENPDTLSAAFVAFCKRVKTAYPMAYKAYCDSAEQILIRGLDAAIKKAGVAVQVVNAHKTEIVDRIRLVTSLMGAGRFFVSPKCRALRDALEAAVWDKDKPKDERLDDGSYNMDVIDAMEYSLTANAGNLRRAVFYGHTADIARSGL